MEEQVAAHQQPDETDGEEGARDREAVREQLDPGGSMGLSAEEFPLTLRVEDRALEVISEDGDEVTVRLTGTMSMDVDEDDIESLALAMLEADMGDELSEEDIEMMLPFVTSPRSECSRFETAFSVVVLPAPFPPRSAVMPPFLTDSDTPFSTRITWL